MNRRQTAGPGFDRARCAAELRGAIKDSHDDWYSQTAYTYIAAGRVDGAATVLAAERGWTPASSHSEVPDESGGVGECRWQVLHYVGDVLTIDTYPTAVTAVGAVADLADPVVTA